MNYSISIVFLLIAMAFALYAQFKVKSAFSQYASVPNHRGITGAQAARMVLDNNGLSDVVIKEISGTLSDHYNPGDRVISLSSDVYRGASIGAISVATHEVGHAIQHERKYALLLFRNTIVPVVNLASAAVWPMVMIGVFLLYSNSWYLGNTLFNIGAIAMSAVVLFHIITLPVELDASRRAINQLQNLGIVDQNEVPGVKRVLGAAAMTYLAAVAVSIANLIRILAIRGNR
ncbi:zinc metallopeptidase [Eubacteriales bacterium KG127]